MCKSVIIIGYKLVNETTSENNTPEEHFIAHMLLLHSIGESQLGFI